MPSKRCSYANCKSDYRYSDKPNMENVRFFKFPSSRIHFDRSKEWVKACGRADFSIKNLLERDKNNKLKTYWICSKHFVENEPTKQNPNPIISTKLVVKKMGRRCEATKEDEAAETLIALGNISVEIAEIDGISFNDGMENASVINIDHSCEAVKEDKAIETIMELGNNSVETAERFFIDGMSLNDSGENLSVAVDPNLCSEHFLEPVNSELLFRNVWEAFSAPDGWFKTIKTEKYDALEVFKILHDSVILKLLVNEDNSISLYIWNDVIEKTHYIFQEIPQVVDGPESLLQVLKVIDTWSLCCGNDEETFKKCYLSIKRKSGYICKNTQAIRATKCSIIFKPTYQRSKRCMACVLFRPQLRSIIFKYKRRNFDVVTKCKRKYKTMKKDDLIKKVKAAKKIERSYERKLSRRDEKLKSYIEEKGKKIDKLSSEGFAKILKNHVNDDENEFAREFLMEQIKMLDKNPKSRKWHPNIIKWCIYMRSKSPSAYRALQESRALQLPTERTLHNYSKNMLQKPGLSKETLLYFQEEFNKVSKKEHEKYVCLSIDEMKVQQDIIYHKSTGEISGFVELDDALEKLRSIEERSKSQDEPLELATHVMQIMVRGITTSLKYPLSFYPTASLNAETLNHLVWNTIRRLEGIGCRVLCVVGDGASSNRKFFQMNYGTDHFCENGFARSEDRPLYFIYDIPHIMKTARNCLSKSGLPKFTKKKISKGKKKTNVKAELPTRRMIKNNKEILWSHLEELYKIDSSNIIRKLPKLKFEHIYLDSYSRMRVKLATQVLSESVALAMEDILGEKASETVKFIRLMDKFFDIMNVSNYATGKRQKNDYKRPIESVEDERLNWLQTEFLSYFEDWEKEIDDKYPAFSKAERKMMQLSQETLEGIRVSTNSIIQIIRFLLNKGAKYILTTHLNQDCLEQHFGKVRSLLGANHNPNAKGYGESNEKTQIIRSFVKAPKNGNSGLILE